MTSLAFALTTFDAAEFWGEVLAVLGQPQQRPALTATPADCFAELQPWVRQDGRLVGHVQLLPIEERDRALKWAKSGRPLVDALLEPWVSMEARERFDDAMEAAQSAFQAACEVRNQARAQGGRRPRPRRVQSLARRSASKHLQSPQILMVAKHVV